MDMSCFVVYMVVPTSFHPHFRAIDANMFLVNGLGTCWHICLHNKGESGWELDRSLYGSPFHVPSLNTDAGGNPLKQE